MDVEPRRQNHSNQGNRPIRLCPEVVVANFKEQNDVKKVSIDELESEPKRLTDPTIHSFSRDNIGEVIGKYFLNSLLKAAPELSYPLPIEYLDKMLLRLEKIFME